MLPLCLKRLHRRSDTEQHFGMDTSARDGERKSLKVCEETNDLGQWVIIT